MILAYIRSDLYLFARKQLYAKEVITCLIKRTISIFKFGELVRMDVFLLYYNRMNLAMIINREWELKKKVTP